MSTTRAIIYGSIVTGALYFTASKVYVENPFTHRKRIILFPESFDIFIGNATRHTVLDDKEEKKVMSYDSPEYNAVAAITKVIVKELPITRKWNVTVVDSPTINAFVIPDGSVFVYTGLLNNLNSIDELGFVMCHECSHVYLRHTANSFSTTIVWSFLLSLVYYLIFGDVSSITDFLTVYLFRLPNSRSNETEADLCGLDLASKIGLKLDSGIQVMKMFQKLLGENTGVEFTRTHPLSVNREVAIAEAIKKYQQKLDQHQHERIRDEKLSEAIKYWAIYTSKRKV
jgi:predicted Zn-dependent protease